MAKVQISFWSAAPCSYWPLTCCGSRKDGLSFSLTASAFCFWFCSLNNLCCCCIELILRAAEEQMIFYSCPDEWNLRAENGSALFLPSLIHIWIISKHIIWVSYSDIHQQRETESSWFPVRAATGSIRAEQNLDQLYCRPVNLRPCSLASPVCECV